VRYVVATLIVLFAYACVSRVPVMEGNKIKSNPDGSTKFRWKPGTGEAEIERALNSKGFKRYKANVSQIVAKEWAQISMYAAVATAVCFLCWLNFKHRFWSGATMSCLALSGVSVCIAELVSMISGVFLVIGAIVLITAGVIFRDKSIFEKVKKWLSPE